MAVYTLFGQTGSGTLQSDTTLYTLGVQFTVSQSGTLTGIWWYGASANGLPDTIALYNATTQTLITSQAASWSGAAGTGWVRAPFTSPPSLTGGTQYEACVFLGSSIGNWYSATSGYWTSGAGSGGITNGPLSAPNNASALNGQDSFHAAAVLAFPANSGGGANYWVDPEFTTAATASIAAQPQAASLLALGLPQSPQFALTPGPPPAVPGAQHAITLLRMQLPQSPQFAAAAAAPPLLPAPQQAITLITRGMATPGHFLQTAPFVPPPPAPGAQQEQAVTLIWQGLPQTPPGPLLPAAPPPVPAPGQAVTLLALGLPQSPPGPQAPGAPPPVPAPAQALNLLLQGLPQTLPSPQLPAPPPPGQQPQHAATLLAQGYAVTLQPTVIAAAPADRRACATVTSQLTGTATVTSACC